MGLTITALKIWNHPLERTVAGMFLTGCLEFKQNLFSAGTIQQHRLNIRWNIFERQSPYNAVMIQHCTQHLLVVTGKAPGPCSNGTIRQGKVCIRNNQSRVKGPLCAQATAFHTRPCGIVKRKHLWR